MHLDEGVAQRTDRLLGLLKDQAERVRSLAELRADIGEAILEIQEDLGEAGIRFETWLAEQQRLAAERGVEILHERTVRRYVQAARFRRRHPPELATPYLMLDPSALREVAGLPGEVLAQYAREGVPVASGARVPLAEATTRQLAWAARTARSGSPPVKAKPPARPDPTPAQEFDEGLAHIRKAGRLNVEQVEQLVEAIVESVAAPGTEEARTTRRILVEAALELGEGDPRRMAADITTTLERLRPVFEAAGAGATPELLERVARALTRLLMALARWAQRLRAA